MSQCQNLNFKMKLLLLAIFLGVTIGQKVRFDYYQVLRLFPTDETQVNVLKNLEMAGEYDFWTRTARINGSVDVMVPPDKETEFFQFLQNYDILHQVQIENVQRLIDEESLYKRCIDMDWNSYHTLDVIYDWIDEISKKYSSVKKVLLGKSYEGRKIKGMEISFQDNATGIFIESGMYGREWITPAVTTWMIKQILDSPADSIFRNFTYYYIPVFNPDGYSYSWSHNRLWKKTRTPYKNRTVVCYGADPNRNWDVNWNKFGESQNPCSESYPGPYIFSEVEMKSISTYLKCLAHSRNVDIYIAYRSYSQRVHYPWSHDTSAPYEALWQEIVEAAAEEIPNVHGTEYDVDGFSDFYEPTGGSSTDWFYKMYDSTVAFTFEVRDKGNYGFLLPPDQIVPTGEELLPALEKILIEYQQLNYTHPETNVTED